MAKIKITLIRNDKVTSKAIKLAQKNIFNTLCKKIFTESDNDSSNWTKEQWDDPHKVFEIEDSTDKCQKAYDQWVNMKVQTWSKLKSSVRESKLYRTLPFKLRAFLNKKDSSESKYYDRFIQYLTLIGIYFNIELIK